MNVNPLLLMTCDPRMESDESDGFEVTGFTRAARQRRQCNECGGSSLCEHGRQRSRCKECGGNNLCEHDRQSVSKCKECASVYIGCTAAKLLDGQLTCMAWHSCCFQNRHVEIYHSIHRWDDSDTQHNSTQESIVTSTSIALVFLV